MQTNSVSVRSAKEAKDSKPTKKPRKVASGQKEMLMPIAGKKPAAANALAQRVYQIDDVLAARSLFRSDGFFRRASC